MTDPRRLPPEPAPERPAPRAGGIAARATAIAAAPAPDYLNGLNPEQREAVETLDGPLLVLAGAGTGKTRVLTARVAHILSQGRAYPSQILVVTFTNKAAREMKDRIHAMVGDQVEGMPWLGTFHSIGVRILRRHHELVGLKSGFTILDTDDQIRLLKQLLTAENIDEKRWPARLLASTIDSWKNRGLSPKDVPPGEGAVFANGRGGTLYAAYQARLKALNAVDFGDLLLEGIRLFRENPDVLAEYHKRFKYLLVDEYQDTNVAQYLWLRLLAQGSKNVCCVGDDDQSIYGWRGAEVDNILRFESDFPGAKVIRLERNYRSTGHILASAAHLIAHNEGRLGKTLFSEGEDGEQVTVTGAWDSGEEARAVGEEIEALQRAGHRLSEIAILVRASFQMREFEDRFVTLGLPYRVIGGPRFYERAEIRDALAYLRCVNSSADDLAFERIVNVPKRGIGDATVKQIHDVARAVGLPLQEAARILTESEELKPKVRATMRGLVDAFGRWREQARVLSHTELAEIVLDESGYTEMWQKDRSAEAAGRLENLKELVRSMEPFENLSGFLEHISLVMDTDNGAGEDAVQIMTLHSAKGLEFDTVFLPGWEEGLFPHQRALDEQGKAGLEEERRLAYVGITRARASARIFVASNRRIHGMWNSTVPSRFLDELPDAHVRVEESRGGAGWGGSSYGGGNYGQSRFDRAEPFSASSYSTPGWQRAQANRGRTDQGGFSSTSSGSSRSGFSERGGRYDAGGSARRGPMVIEGTLVATSAGPASAFRTGERVFHIKFGYGEVTGIDGNKLTVQFDKAGEKRVLETFVDKV
ncbi:ATP-dependent helicase [Xanthobacter oligotrophicus]|uniref:ATP-dependent helicase n=1 Tax=Xanthobacter oligotrophicus TaxID=2607286 RepID=UPI0011F2F570|nr:UvrD-helicase domain-containing protein [Xanthobacter oligotrophicus]MCG5236489.1 UvrD-helicase domain-containing protein [Xanthobacter oligotrophicus]